MFSTSKMLNAEDTFCYRDFKTYNICFVIGLILLSALKTTKHTKLYPTTHYCTSLQGVKERIA